MMVTGECMKGRSARGKAGEFDGARARGLAEIVLLFRKGNPTSLVPESR